MQTIDADCQKLISLQKVVTSNKTLFQIYWIGKAMSRVAKIITRIAVKNVPTATKAFSCSSITETSIAPASICTRNIFLEEKYDISFTTGA
jgi:hypothetical protein